MSSPGEGAEINPATPFEVKPDEGSAYKFSQTLGECTVQIPIPKGTRGKMMTVELRRNRLAAGLKGQEALIKGQLYADIDTDESVWTIEESKDGSALVLHLEKVQKGKEWWPSVIKGHPGLDVKKIQPENSKLSDLDGDTRAMVEKMMFDQRQKEMNKPTSDELKKQEMLEKFMKQHPEMDFSNAKLA